MPTERVQVTHRNDEDLKAHLNTTRKLLTPTRSTSSQDVLELFDVGGTKVVDPTEAEHPNAALMRHMMSAEVQAALNGANYVSPDAYSHLRSVEGYRAQQHRWKRQQPFVVRESDWAILGITSPTG